MILSGTYKKILDRIPEGVFVFDYKLRIQFVNTAFRRSFSDNVKKRRLFGASFRLWRAGEMRGRCFLWILYFFARDAGGYQ